MASDGGLEAIFLGFINIQGELLKYNRILRDLTPPYIIISSEFTMRRGHAFERHIFSTINIQYLSCNGICKIEYIPLLLLIFKQSVQKCGNWSVGQ